MNKAMLMRMAGGFLIGFSLILDPLHFILGLVGIVLLVLAKDE